MTVAFVSQIAVAGEVTLRTDSLEVWDRQEVRHFILALLPWSASAGVLDDGRGVTLDCGAVGTDVCAKFSSTLDRDGQADPAQVEALWLATYHKTRSQRDDEDVVPDTLSEFADRHGYRQWPQAVVERSMVKRARRVLYRGRLPDGRAMSVAETRPEGGEPREVELAVQSHLDPGSYNFYVYDGSGRLAEESEFPAGMRDAPKVCTACHMDRETGVVNRFLP